MGMVARVLLNELIMMAMSDNNKDPLSQYEGKSTYPPLEKKVVTAPLIKALEDYKAFEPFGNRKGPRFRIVDAEGKSYGCSYAHLLDWVFTPPTLLTITTATPIFTLKGNHLKAIEKALMDEKLKELFVYNDKHYKQPAEGNTIIEELTIFES